ncbi:hypothetical protein [Streptomyces yaizuensis]|uniref:Uncharacterized protein n=1 Tax=Streptomyces yaizuensis TaxID=2989713 RepID=A0ABQ5P6F6_9ACTN|nr:hypothetical protein [Streptomyces sp. YSPA8]GLF98160.1 hypothetical protein SYYSPA8_27705 [Streptomyces sp. YSPA8]
MPSPPSLCAIWFVVRGESPGTQAVDPGQYGVDIPNDVLTWAESHGLDPADPDIYLLVAPANEADPEVTGEMARCWHPLHPETEAQLREAWEEAH